MYHQKMSQKNLLQTPEFQALNKLVDRVLAVPGSEVKRRVEEHRKQAAENPNRRGPKRKVTIKDDAQSS